MFLEGTPPIQTQLIQWVLFDFPSINGYSIILVGSLLYTCERSRFRLFETFTLQLASQRWKVASGLRNDSFFYLFFGVLVFFPKDSTNSDPIDTTGVSDLSSINSVSMILLGSLIDMGKIDFPTK